MIECDFQIACQLAPSLAAELQYSRAFDRFLFEENKLGRLEETVAEQSEGADASGATVRNFFVYPDSRLIGVFGKALWYLGFSDSANLYYVARNVKFENMVTFTLSIPLFPALCVSGSTVIESISETEATTCVQHTHISINTGSTWLDVIVGTFLEGVLRQEYERLARTLEKYASTFKS
jgi:hypothetical protein